MAVQIALTRGLFAIVDDDDVAMVQQHKWCATPGRYAVRSVYPRAIRYTAWMHRVVANAPAGVRVDHINGDTLDNRRANLRFCTHLQNMQNRRVNPETITGFKGVRVMGSRFHARIQFEGKPMQIGAFGTAVEAAEAYDAMAVKLFGPFARLNFPKENGAGFLPDAASILPSAVAGLTLHARNIEGPDP